MEVLVVVDGHLGRTPDGRVWSARIYDYAFFARYLSAFEQVRVAMRIHDIPDNSEYPNLCSGDRVEFMPIEEFKGPKEYATKYLKIKRTINHYFEGCDCAIFRIPSTIGYQFWKAYKKTGKPYSVEVVVDPWDFAAPGMLNTPLRPLIRKVWTDDLKKACLQANGVSYVTKYALQERYPSYARLHGETEQHFESYYSSVNISSHYLTNARKYTDSKNIKIIHVTNFIGNHVKGHEELIKALKIVRDKTDKDVRVQFVGEGTMIEAFKELAKQERVGQYVEFTGKLTTNSAVREALLNADLFVFPSHAEGLPRVLIEAMAVGLPCISTRVNGIPELLDDHWLIEVGDVMVLAEKIVEMVESTEIMDAESNCNIEKAKEYTELVLQNKRNIFYTKLKRLAKQGLSKR